MTIAGCFLTRGGLVLGADSTTTYGLPGTERQLHFNYAQKLFEVGEDSTLGIVTWGWAGHSTNVDATVSFRSRIAELADVAVSNPFTSVKDAAERWATKLWPPYQAALQPEHDRIEQLSKLAARTDDENKELNGLRIATSVGFCLGGHVLPSRQAEAWKIIFEPGLNTAPTPAQLASGAAQFWGVPMLINRLTVGIDMALRDQILMSPHWQGTPKDLMKLVAPHVLSMPPTLPIREAIDYMHSAIYTTCQGLKFSTNAPVCGGPVEVAVITSDRRFRWVTHKTLHEAVANF